MSKRLHWLALSLLLAAAARGGALREYDFNAESQTAAKVLQQWYNEDGLWDSAGWWNAANCIESIEDVIRARNGGEYLQVLATTFERHAGGHFTNEFYDDEGWWTLAWTRAFDLTGEARYLDAAKFLFADMKGGWDNHCGGGIWWKKSRHYKNAIANELFLLAAIRLHERTCGDAGAESYLDWAQREWAWFKKSGMINERNLVNDGLDEYCENNGRTAWTYNQGVLIGGLVELYRSAGDTNALLQARAIADAVITNFVDDHGVLQELREWRRLSGTDVPQFKGIFAAHVAELYDVTHDSKYRDLLVHCADSILEKDRDASNRFGGRWCGPVDAVDAIRQSSAMRAIGALAEPATTNLAVIETAGSPACQHDVGAATGASAWKFGGAGAKGFAVLGPAVASLSEGRHIVHFRLAADAISKSAQKLVRLEVGRGWAVFASRDVRWNEFRRESQTVDFAVAFKNPKPPGPVQFRIFWNAPLQGPVLTATDISVDGALNLSAANMEHEVGELDQFNYWRANPIQTPASGWLAKASFGDELPAGQSDVYFELKAANANCDDDSVASISVIDLATQQAIATRELRRSEFPTTLFQTFVLPIRVHRGQRVEARVFWHRSATAPGLTLRSIIVKPRSGTFRRGG